MRTTKRVVAVGTAALALAGAPLATSATASAAPAGAQQAASPSVGPAGDADSSRARAKAAHVRNDIRFASVQNEPTFRSSEDSVLRPGTQIGLDCYAIGQDVKKNGRHTATWYNIGTVFDDRYVWQGDLQRPRGGFPSVPAC